VHCHNLGSRFAQPEIDSKIDSAAEGELLSLLTNLIPGQQNKLLAPRGRITHHIRKGDRAIEQIHTTSGKGIG